MSAVSERPLGGLEDVSGRPLRVLFLRNLFFPEDLGGNRYPFEVVSRMARRGHELTVVTARSRDRARRARPPAEMRLCTYPVARGHPFLTYASHTLVAAAAMARMPKATYDVAVAGSYDVALAAQRLPWLRHLPFVFIYHSEFYSVWAERLRRADRSPVPARLLARATTRHMGWVEQRVLRDSDAIVAVSDFSRRQIAARAPEVASRVRVLPTGVDTGYFVPAPDRAEAKARLGLDPSTPLVLGVGRLTPVKRFDRLVGAMAELRRREARAQLALVGDGPEAGALRRLASGLGLGDGVHFAGYRDGSGVRAYMQAADLQVCSSEFEHHSLAILEALASGLPVLGTRAGGTPEILEQVDPRLLLRGPEPAAIADAIAALLDDADGLRALGLRSRALAEQRYDWEAVVSDLERLLAQVAGSRPGRAPSETAHDGGPR